jgi:hypothetical protein
MAYRQMGGTQMPHEQDRRHCPSINAAMREVLHKLGNIDFEQDIELHRLEASSADQALKNHVKAKIRAAHDARRGPYVELLATLRQRQHRQSYRA